eukprot:scaffold54196_cov40-Prasinocladus_malaysianus.AAC.3
MVSSQPAHRFKLIGAIRPPVVHLFTPLQSLLQRMQGFDRINSTEYVPCLIACLHCLLMPKKHVRLVMIFGGLSVYPSI